MGNNDNRSVVFIKSCKFIFKKNQEMKALTIIIGLILMTMVIFGGCTPEQLPQPKDTSFSTTYDFGANEYTQDSYQFGKFSYGYSFAITDTFPNYTIIFDTLYPGIVDKQYYNISIGIYTPDSAKLLTSVKANANNKSLLHITQINDSTYNGSFSAEYYLDSNNIGFDSIVRLEGSFEGFIK